MGAFMADLIAKLFGLQQPQLIRLRIDLAPKDNLFKGPK